MARTLLRWRGVTLHAYPTMLGLGSIVGIVTATRLAPWLGLPPGRTYVALVLLLIPALVGSRLLFVLMRWPRFRGDLRSVWRTSDGGLSLYGGLVLSSLSSTLLLPTLGLPFAAFWDAAAVVILIGMAFTKVGCHVNGCCLGRTSTRWFAMDATDVHGQHARRIPAQLLESALAIVLLSLAITTRAQRSVAGALFLTATVGYGVGRFALESIRDTSGRRRDVTVNRAISVALSATAALALWFGVALR